MGRPIILAALGLCAAVVALITWNRLTVDTPPPSPSAATSEHQPSAPASRPPTPPAVTVPVPDRLTADPETVATQALTIMFSPQPGIDGSGGDAYRRAAPWLSPRMQTEATRTDSGPGAQWDDWRTRHVTIVAHVELGCSGCRPDTPTTVQRVATIIQFATDPAGRTRAENALTAWVTITRQQDGWRVDALTF